MRLFPWQHLQRARGFKSWSRTTNTSGRDAAVGCTIRGGIREIMIAWPRFGAELPARYSALCAENVAALPWEGPGIIQKTMNLYPHVPGRPHG